jgi:hypothetical protein
MAALARMAKKVAVFILMAWRLGFESEGFEGLKAGKLLVVGRLECCGLLRRKIPIFEEEMLPFMSCHQTPWRHVKGLLTRSATDCCAWELPLALMASAASRPHLRPRIATRWSHR